MRPASLLLPPLLLAVALVSCTGDTKPPVTKPSPDLLMPPLFPDCMDGWLDQGESDIDCGGPCTKKCAEGQKCGKSADCGSGICLMGTCAPTSICTDAAKDGDETDIDCGGQCPACTFGKVCGKATDCRSGSCVAGKCAPLKAGLAAGRGVPLGMQPTAVLAVDLDGDSILDLAAVSNGVDKLFVALGKGDAKYDTAVAVTCPQVTGPENFAAADLDADGKNDLVVTAGGKALVLYNTSTTGMPSFKMPKEIASVGSTPTAPILVDVDGDKKPDLVNLDLDYDSNASGYQLYVTQNGTTTAGMGAWKSPRRIFVGGDQPTSPVVADWNGDGKPDIGVLAGGKVLITAGRGDGGFGAWISSVTGTFTAQRIGAGDFDPDNNVDVVAIDRGGGAVGIMAGYGDGTLTRALKTTSPPGPIWLVVADFDLDDKLDVATLNGSDDTIGLSLGQGGRKLVAGPVAAGGTSPIVMSAGDLNGDGRIDLVAANPGSDQVTLILNTSK